MAGESYEGWANWATWQVNLWVDNEEFVYKSKIRQGRRCDFDKDSAKEFFLEWFPKGTPDMDSVKELDAVDWEEIASTWNEECCE